MSSFSVESKDSRCLAQDQLDAYNRQDLDAFCAVYSSDVIVADLNGPVIVDGLPALRARYAKVLYV